MIGKRSLVLILLTNLFLTFNLRSAWEYTEGSVGQINSIYQKSGKLYAASYGNGVYYSQTSGYTWVTINKNLTSNLIWDVKMVKNDLYCATEGAGTFKSTDNGANWSKAIFGLGNLNVYGLAVANDKVLYAITEESGIFMTDDDGKNWKSINVGDINKRLFTITTDGSSVYIGAEFGNLFKTNNDGMTWENLKSAPLAFNIKALYVSGNRILAGTTNGIFISDNAGGTWKAINNGLKSTDINSIVVIDNKIFVGTNDAGVFFTDNDGIVWFEANEELSDPNVLALSYDSQYLFAGTSNSGITRRKLSEFVAPKVVAPSLTSPENNATYTDVDMTLRWSSVTGAVSYHVQLSENDSFTPIFREKDDLTNTFFNFTGLDKGKKYYWRVASNPPKGSKVWSEIWSFTTKTDLLAPELIYPEDNAVVPMPVTFNWQEAQGAVSYILQIAADSLFELFVETSGEITETTYKSSSLSQDSTYFWKVYSVAPDANKKESEVRKFTAVKGSSVSEYNNLSNINIQYNFNTLHQDLTVSINSDIMEYAKVVIFDFMGRPVVNLFEGTLQNGLNEYKYNYSPLPNGLYLITVETNNGIAVKKIILLK